MLRLSGELTRPLVDRLPVRVVDLMRPLVILLFLSLTTALSMMPDVEVGPVVVLLLSPRIFMSLVAKSRKDRFLSLKKLSLLVLRSVSVYTSIPANFYATDVTEPARLFRLDGDRSKGRELLADSRLFYTGACFYCRLLRKLRC